MSSPFFRTMAHSNKFIDIDKQFIRPQTLASAALSESISIIYSGLYLSPFSSRKRKGRKEGRKEAEVGKREDVYAGGNRSVPCGMARMAEPCEGAIIQSLPGRFGNSIFSCPQEGDNGASSPLWARDEKGGALPGMLQAKRLLQLAVKAALWGALSRLASWLVDKLLR